jgi:hypothetical protein
MEENAGGNMSKRISLPCVSYTRPRCPYCHAVDSRTRRTVQQADGTQLAYVTCANTRCKKRFSILAE